jgi:RNA polymerase sigma-70 factor (ECF subfamily)
MLTKYRKGRIYINIEGCGYMDGTNDNLLEVNSIFYDKYNSQIRAIVTRILNNANQTRDIDDCVNNIYLELIEKLKQYNETRGSIAAFVAIVARSTALNYCKSNMRKNGELIGDDKIDFISEPIEIENKVEFEMLVKSIKEKLNKEERILFTMRYIYYYSPDEIANAFQIKRNTVDKRVSRLKNKVKNILIKGGIIL